MSYSRREFGKLALAGVPAAALFGNSTLTSALAQMAKPNSMFNGVQIGTITYSYRSMADQSAEATLKYITESGISAVELMGGPVNDWARKKGGWDSSAAASAAAAVSAAQAAAAGGGAGAGGGRGGGGGRGAGREGGAREGGPAPFAPQAGMMTGPGNNQAAGQWNGTPCPAPGARGGGGGGRGGRGGAEQAELTPEQREMQRLQQASAEAERKWRMALPMSIFTDLRKMYNDAGVTMYAVKDVRQGTDEDLEYTFTVAQTLGANHVTLELPSGPNAAATLKRLGDWAAKKNMFVAYHTHQQGSMTCFDEAFAISKANMANIDLGHLVAATDPQGTPLDFLNKHHARISSFHLKDRTSMAHCAQNLAWGTGETPIKEILQLVAKNQWKIPASIELEYSIPAGSNAVLEVKKCVEYCRAALA
jgi:sugar phosphate isomerase/epimerase